MIPIRYFLINAKTRIAHASGYCAQTKPRSVPIRLFDSLIELENHVGHPVRLCKDCRRQLEKEH